MTLINDNKSYSSITNFHVKTTKSFERNDATVIVIINLPFERISVKR